jgi:hypothetical protein
MSEATKPTIKFEFTIDQINGLLAGLGKSPAEFSMFGIQLIQEQAGPQIQAIKIAEAKELAKKGDAANEQ